MKCYYHDNREAVATCKCGKCLCRECADAHTPIMCSSCWSANQKELQKEIETNRVLIKRNEENAKKKTLGINFKAGFHYICNIFNKLIGRFFDVFIGPCINI